MGGGSNDPRGMITGINVTPLVDVTLVLLIILMVTAKVVVSPAVPMELPRASRAEHVQVVFSVLLPRDGSVLANGRAMANDTTLATVARQAVLRDPQVRAVIQADGEVPHRSVIHTLDVLKSAGIEHIAFGALPEEAR